MYSLFGKINTTYPLEQNDTDENHVNSEMETLLWTSLITEDGGQWFWGGPPSVVTVLIKER